MGEEVDLGYKRNVFGYTKKSDLHSLAVIYNIFATKYHPFDASSPKKIYANICNKPLQIQTSDDVPFDQRILDLINRLGAKDPAKRPTAQEALDEAHAIDEAIKAEHAEEVLENNVQAIGNEQNARYANAMCVSAKLKKSARFKIIQLEERLRDLTLASERERTE